MWRDLLKRRYARSIIIVFISIACNLSLLLAAARAEARPLLRVGIHQFGSDITEDSSGNFHGMETDFMQALGSYAGREVIFVPGTWEECQQRLEQAISMSWPASSRHRSEQRPCSSRA